MTSIGASDNGRTRRATSVQKIVADRRNALRSTGPRTAQGKQVTRLNAIKHGLLAKDLVLTMGGHREKRQEFEALYGAH